MTTMGELVDPGGAGRAAWSAAGQTAEAAVVHSSATRTRLRVPRRDRGKGGLERIQQVAEQQPGVTGVDVNPATGSVLIHHRKGAAPIGGFAAALGDVGIVLRGLEEGDIGGPGQNSEAAETVEAALGDLNRRVALASGGRVDLKLLLPAGLIGAGIWRVATDPTALFTEIPTIVLFWFGIDLYAKFRDTGGDNPAGPGAAAQPSA
jgi:hypothetical protein